MRKLQKFAPSGEFGQFRPNKKQTMATGLHTIPKPRLSPKTNKSRYLRPKPDENRRESCQFLEANPSGTKSDDAVFIFEFFEPMRKLVVAFAAPPTAKIDLGGRWFREFPKRESKLLRIPVFEENPLFRSN
ncbi:MAG: hypothetical protein GY737_09780 [Desulfobacteraceae bacterium]|nr:hypothetical protein [Desulfobacteraceae bacterium]